MINPWKKYFSLYCIIGWAPSTYYNAVDFRFQQTSSQASIYHSLWYNYLNSELMWITGTNAVHAIHLKFSLQNPCVPLDSAWNPRSSSSPWTIDVIIAASALIPTSEGSIGTLIRSLRVLILSWYNTSEWEVINCHRVEYSAAVSWTMPSYGRLHCILIYSMRHTHNWLCGIEGYAGNRENDIYNFNNHTNIIIVIINIATIISMVVISVIFIKINIIYMHA